MIGRTRNGWSGAAAALLLLTLASACSDDDDDAGASTTTSTAVTTTSTTTSSAPTTSVVTTAPATMAPTTSAPATTSVASTAPPTAPATSPPTTAAATQPPTTAACTDEFDVAPFDDGFPSRLSTLVGEDIRTGAHRCFERVVIELGGSGDMPGVLVEYVDDPVRLGPSGETVDVAGDATLVISFGAWMPAPEGAGYDGPARIVPTNVEHVLELRRLENFEGMAAWAIGLDRERGFRTQLFTGPPRIVVDIAVD